MKGRMENTIGNPNRKPPGTGLSIGVKKTVFYVILSAVVLAYFFVRLPELRRSFSIGTTAPNDFPQDYIAGRQLLAGKSVYPSHFADIYTSLLSINESQQTNVYQRIEHLNPHPPFTAMLLFPLWFLSFHQAAFLWGLITILCMFLSIFLLIKSEDISLLYFPLISLFVLAWPPFQSNLYFGQISVLVTLFVTTGWYFLKKHRENMSGIFIALATMLKFYPGLFIVYFLVTKRWKAFRSSIIISGVIIILTLIVTKYDFFHLIFNVMPQDIKYWQADMMNSSLNGFFSKLFLPMLTFNTTAFTLFISSFMKNLLFYTTAGSLLFYSILYIIRYNHNNDLGFSLFLILSLLLSPLCWDHFFTLLLISFVILIKELIRRNNNYEITIFIISLLLISIDESSVYFNKTVYLAHVYLLGKSANIIDTLTFFSAQFYGMVLLLFLNFWMIKKTASAGVENSIKTTSCTESRGVCQKL
jgi:hypothetical protein